MITLQILADVVNGVEFKDGERVECDQSQDTAESVTPDLTIAPSLK